jgi:chlorobactene glucosyltransferase
MEIEWATIAGFCFILVVLTKVVWKSRAFPRFLKMEMSAASYSYMGAGEPDLLVSVIIPANNESHCIAKSAKAILESKNCRLELILANDRSQDNTLQIMEQLAKADSRIKVVSVNELPAGWTGKTNAMFRGAEIASGEILVFTDADTILNPNALHMALDLLLRRKLDLLSLVPGFTERGFIEDAIFPILAMGLLHYHPLQEVNDQNKPAAFASGPFLMMPRRSYEKIGTWRCLRKEVTEDIALAKAVKGQRMKLMVLRGSNLVKIEPFKSMSHVCHFWGRVYYGGLDRRVSNILRLILNHAALLVTYLLFGITGLLWLTQPTFWIQMLFLLSAVTVGIVSGLHIVFIKQQRGSWVYGLAAPIGFFIGICVSSSALLAILFHRGIRWRGSSYM